MFNFPNIFIKKVFLESKNTEIEFLVKENKENLRGLVKSNISKPQIDVQYYCRLYILYSQREIATLRELAPTRQFAYKDFSLIGEVYVEENGKRYDTYNSELLKDIDEIEGRYITLRYTISPPAQPQTPTIVFGAQLMKSQENSPLIFEVVKVSNRYNLKSSVFYDNNGGLWSKPVYSTNGSFYKTPGSTKELNKKDYPNATLINLNKFIEDFSNTNFGFLEANREPVSFSKVKNYMSVDEKKRVKNLITIDIESILSDSSKFSEYFSRIESDQYKNSIYRNTELKNIIVYRINTSNKNIENFQIQSGDEDGLLKDIVRYTDTTEEKIVSSISEEEVSIFGQIDRFRYFTFIDHALKDKTDGEYFYKYEFIFKDGVEEYLKNIFEDFKGLNLKINEYTNFLEFNIDKFGNVRNDFQLPSTFNWRNLVDRFLDIMSRLRPQFNPEDYIYLYSLFNPKNVKPKYLDYFREINNRLIARLSQETDISSDDNLKYRGAEAAINLSYNTRDKISSKSIRDGILYIKGQEERLSYENLDINFVQDRANQELRKYFSTTEDLSISAHNKDYLSSVDVDNESISFLSPIGIINKDVKFDLEKGGASHYNLNKLNKVASNVLKNKSNYSGGLKFINNNIREVDEDQKLLFQDVFGNNWDQKEFLKKSADEQSAILENDTFSTKTAFDSVRRKKSTNIDPSLLDISNPNNIIDKRGLNNLKGVPNQIKSLIALSDEKNNKKVNLDYLSSDGNNFDINYINEGSYLLNYVLLGHVKYAISNDNLSNIIWKTLTRNIIDSTNKKLLCKIDIDPDILSFDGEAIKKITIYNKYFIINVEESAENNNVGKIVNESLVDSVEEIDRLGSEYLNSGVFRI